MVDILGNAVHDLAGESISGRRFQYFFKRYLRMLCIFIEFRDR